MPAGTGVWLNNSLAYCTFEPAELEKIAGTVHHGGIVAIEHAHSVRPEDARLVLA